MLKQIIKYIKRGARENLLLTLSKVFGDKQSKVIFYHDVHVEGNSYTGMSTSISRFKQHISLLEKEGFKIVERISQPELQIMICFDDGFRGIYDNRDYFKYQKIYPTVFLAVELIGERGYLTEKEILELQTMGFVFESHAYSHKDLTTFSDTDLKYELDVSKRHFESLLSKPITSICFPIGRYSERVIRFCHQGGYQKLYSSLPGSYVSDPKDGLIYRNLVQFATDKELKAILNGGMTPLRWWYKRKHFSVPNTIKR